MTYMAYISKQLEIEDKVNIILVISKCTTYQQQHVIQLNLRIEYLWRGMDFYLLLKMLAKTANICLCKEVLKTFWARLWRRLQRNSLLSSKASSSKTSWRCLENLLMKTSGKHVLKYLEDVLRLLLDVFGKCLTNMS